VPGAALLTEPEQGANWLLLLRRSGPAGDFGDFVDLPELVDPGFFEPIVGIGTRSHRTVRVRPDTPTLSRKIESRCSRLPEPIRWQPPK
jgi:hypothetical protein